MYLKNKLFEINKFFFINPNVHFVQDELANFNEIKKHSNSRSFFYYSKSYLNFLQQALSQ